MTDARRPDLPAATRDAGTIEFRLPDSVVQAVAERAAALVADRLEQRTAPYLDVAAAAEYLACPKSRVYALVSAGRIPHRRDGSRLLFRAAELDEWLDQGGGRRP